MSSFCHYISLKTLPALLRLQKDFKFEVHRKEQSLLEFLKSDMISPDGDISVYRSIPKTIMISSVTMLVNYYLNVRKGLGFIKNHPMTSLLLGFCYLAAILFVWFKSAIISDNIFGQEFGQSTIDLSLNLSQNNSQSKSKVE